LRGTDKERNLIVETVGGFQGGVVFGASFVLYVVAFNMAGGKKRLPEAANTILSTLGVSLYAGIGLLCILLSWGAAQFLNYGFIPFTSHFEKNRALGIELVEIGIGITVMAISASIFFDLAGKEEDKEGSEKD